MNPHRDKTYYIRGKNGSSLRCFCWVSHVVGGGHCSLFRVLVVTLAFASLHTRDAAPSNSPHALTGHECDAAPQGVASPVIRNPAAEQGNMRGHSCTMSAKTRQNLPFSTISQAKPQQALAPLRPSVVIALTRWPSLLKNAQYNEASWSEMPRLSAPVRRLPTK